jgi:hypothetical protein
MDQVLKAGTVAAGLVLATVAAPAGAVNRCITADGRTVYTDGRCESLGAKPHGRVSDSISVVPAAPVPQRVEPARTDQMPSFERNVRPAVFRKSATAPSLSVCYDAKEARADVSVRDVESAIRDALALWNAGCNINYEYHGLCPADADLWQRKRADYKVYWSTWDDSLRMDDDPEALARKHAIAMAGVGIGISLNRAAAVPAWRWHRAILHEFGHVVGAGHSANPGDLMYSGGKQRTPTATDYQLCNRAIEVRYGIKAEFR